MPIAGGEVKPRPAKTRAAPDFAVARFHPLC
jgi:hypothetical protein